jgi:beta-fructofuranosidase
MFPRFKSFLQHFDKLMLNSQNFEVGNVFTLSETGYGNEGVAGDFFTTIGTEGGDYPVALQSSPEHDMLWINGNVTKSENGTVHFEPTMAGVLDWGIQSYAAAGKILPASSQASKNSGTTVDRFLSYLWLTNDDYGTTNFPKQQQGWDGSLLTARELSKGAIKNVVDNSLVHEKASWQVTSRNDSTGTVDLTTLQQKIVRETYSAFTKNATNVLHQPASKLKSSRDFNVSPDSKFFVLKASIEFYSSARNDSTLKAGFKIIASEYESTSIYYRKCSTALRHT